MHIENEKTPLIKRSLDKSTFGSFNTSSDVVELSCEERGSREVGETTQFVSTSTTKSRKVDSLRKRSPHHPWNGKGEHEPFLEEQSEITEGWKKWGATRLNEVPYSNIEAGNKRLKIIESRQQKPGCGERMINFIALLVIIVIPIFWFLMFKTVKEFERALIFRLGRVQDKVRGPGLFWWNPLLDKVLVVDLRIEAITLEPQDMMTKDSVTVRVDGLVYLKVTDPVKAVLEVEDYRRASQMFAAASLRSAIGSATLETLLSKRDRVNVLLKEVVERECKKWGVAITAIEIRDLTLPQQMQRPMAAEAETERDRRAAKISSLGELEAAANLAQAGPMICSSTPGGMSLRYLYTLTNIAAVRKTTIIYPLIMKLFTPSLRQFGRKFRSPLRTN